MSETPPFGRFAHRGDARSQSGRLAGAPGIAAIISARRDAGELRHLI